MYLDAKIASAKVLDGFHCLMMSDPVDKILAQWRDERPDLDASSMMILGRTARIARHFDKSLGAVFSKFGLHGGEFDVLATLRRSGAPYQLSPTALFQAMMVSSGTMTNRIDRLEDAALVKRIPDPGDRRGTLIQLTDKGFDLIEEAVEAHVANGSKLLQGLTESERQDLSDLLRKLLLSLEPL
ncbi:MarR family winged helix-turn-helix transcriptional regulator [Vacuolonema iberomarrocanum]|uniref:MarR family winged helix-turn-helix transcriptional regulator n=1 Tax=Vacuolonema iberomarrocanum TaxID=3454632 RepID=UPI003F6DB858